MNKSQIRNKIIKIRKKKFDKSLQINLGKFVSFLKIDKLNLKNISSVTYLMLPTPHFLIEECDIHFSNDPKEKILKAKHLKINVFSKNLNQKKGLIVHPQLLLVGFIYKK